MDPRPANQNSAADLRKTVVGFVDDRWNRFRKAFDRCRHKCSEESIHALRIASRRLLAALEAVSSLVADDALAGGHRTLKKLLSLLGPARDAQIQTGYLAKLSSRYPELKQLLKALAVKEEKLISHAGRKLKKKKIGRLQRLIARSRKAIRGRLPGASGGQRRFHKLLNTVGAAFRVVARRRNEIDPSDPKTIHRMRVAFKRFRYLAELLERLRAGVTARQLQQMNDFQAMMGEIQDLQVVEDFLRRQLQRRKSRKIKPPSRVHTELSRLRSERIHSFLDVVDRVHAFWNP